MPIPSTSSYYHWMFSLKIILISAGVLSMAVILKFSVPVISDFVFYELPSIWNLIVHSWLRPPYLYLLINCIIISIVASSKLQQKLEDLSLKIVETDSPISVVKVTDDVRTDYTVYSSGVVLNGCGFDTSENVVARISEVQVDDSDGLYGRVEVESKASETATKMNDEKPVPITNGGVDGAVSRPMWSGLQTKDSTDFFSLNDEEKPPVSSRFGHRKVVKSSPEGKALGVSKPKRHDTLETTWKTITEGRSIPLTRHLKKSDTWDSRRYPPADQNTPPRMKKSETFTDRSSGNSSLSPSPGGTGSRRKEPSLSQDELNRRVEAFIKKFNEEMRLQRQESLNQYQEMIRRVP